MVHGETKFSEQPAAVLGFLWRTRRARTVSRARPPLSAPVCLPRLRRSPCLEEEQQQLKKAVRSSHQERARSVRETSSTGAAAAKPSCCQDPQCGSAWAFR